MDARLHARRTITALVTTVLVGGLVGALAVPAGAKHRGPTVEPVADGFAGPLGLAVDHRNTAYVGEAFSGLLTTIDRRGDRDVLVDSGGHEIAGVDANWLHVSYVATRFNEPGNPESGVADATLDRVRPNGTTTSVASLHDHEVDTNPDADVTYGFIGVDEECLATLPEFIPAEYTGIIESHPYAVRNVLEGHVVADAAANAILRVSHTGRIRTLAVLPPVEQVIDQATIEANGFDPCLLGATYRGEPVPTDIEVGPGGHYYVTTLPGAPEVAGSGALWRINRFTGSVRLVATGFDGAVDLAVGPDGSIYVAELFGNEISRVSRRGQVSSYVEVPSPGAIEMGRGHTLWATTDVFANGTLVRIER